MKHDDLIKRIVKTKKGRTIKVYDSCVIGYVRFVVNGVQCERLHRESKPFKFGLYS